MLRKFTNKNSVYNKSYDCSYCILTKRKKPFNPFTHSGPNVDPYLSLKQHMGVCSGKTEATVIAKRIREEEKSHPQEISDQVVQYNPLIHHDSLLPRKKQSKPNDEFIADHANFILDNENYHFNMIDDTALQARVTQSLSTSSSSSSTQHDTSSSFSLSSSCPTSSSSSSSSIQQDTSTSWLQRFRGEEQWSPSLLDARRRC